MRAIVVGAGIGGPVVGMWLRRLGWEVVIAEARAEVALAEGAFLGVAPNGMNVLDTLGVSEPVAARGHACSRFVFMNRGGREIGAIDRSGDQARFGWPLTMIRRGELHAVLAEEAARRGAVVRYGMRLAAIDTRPSSVAARFTNGDEIEGDLLIGADGVRSTVRALAVPDAPAPAFSGLFDFGGFVRARALPFAPGVNAMVFGRRAFFGAFTTPGGETWWFHNGPPPAEGDTQDIRSRLLALHAEAPTWIADILQATPEILGPWPIHELAAMPRWSSGRVGLVGDAAHAMSPSAGQGASMAMEDAMVLARCLRDVRDPAEALPIFERQRRPRVGAIFKDAQRASGSKTPPGPVSEWFRDRLLPLFLKLGSSAQSNAYAYRIDWAERAA